jgi:hypothetical protein
VSVSRTTRTELVSRLTDEAPRAPHLVDLVPAVAKGLAFAVLTAGQAFPFIGTDERRAMLFVVGDDFLLSAGPEAFHRKTLRRLLGRAVFVGIAPGRPVRAFYGRAIAAALAAKGWAVIVETQSQQAEAWRAFAARHAKVSVEVMGS